jgi:hypothetical protein
MNAFGTVFFLLMFVLWLIVVGSCRNEMAENRILDSCLYKLEFSGDPWGHTYYTNEWVREGDFVVFLAQPGDRPKRLTWHSLVEVEER